MRLLLMLVCLCVGFIPKAALANSKYEFTIKVIDEKKEPLVGVNVFSEDGSINGVTDIDGKVVLTDPPYSTIINFSYLGYQTVKTAFYKIRQNGGVVQMKLDLGLLPEIVVIGRRDEKPSDIPYRLGTISQKQIRMQGAQTPAAALEQNENVFVQRSQMGGGSPSIRGFEANKVLLVVDGVRMNNAIYRAGHLQNSITLDNNILERIEVIYGPGSLNYGSDALGGVIHFRTKDPILAKDGVKNITNTNVYTRYSTANSENTLSANLNYGTEHWGSLTSITYARYGDLIAGKNRPEAYPDFGKRIFFANRVENIDQIVESSDPNAQVTTGYTQLDFLQKIKFQKHQNRYWLFNFQYSTSSNVPRYDFLTLQQANSSKFQFVEWYYGPQQRLLASAKRQSLRATKIYDKATYIASFQKIDEDRYTRRLRNARREFDLQNVFVYSFTADFDKYIGANRNTVFTYGVDVNHNEVLAEAGTINIRTEKVLRDVNSRYPSGGSRMTTYAGYANLRHTLKDSIVTLFAGLRYSYVDVHSLFSETDPIAWPTYFYTQGIGTTNDAVNWSGGMNIRTPNKWMVSILGGTAFHSPNVDDFAKFRERNNFVSVPNPDLRPENMINGELSLGKEIGSVRQYEGFNLLVNFTGYYTLLNNAIVRKNFALPNGDTTIFSNGELFRIQSAVNTNQAFIYGYSANIKATFGGKFELRSAYNYTYGRIKLDNGTSPLDHIAPVFGNTALAFQHEKLRLEAVVRYNGWKRIADYGGGEDNPEFATPEGTYAWTTYNFYAAWQFASKFRLDAGLENITDLHYRVFASGISAPGRNFIVALKASF